MPEALRPGLTLDHGFRYVAADLGIRLRGGEWKPGVHLPSLRKLAERYGVGVKTVRLATQELREQGLLAITLRHRLLALATGQVWIPTPRPILLVLGFHLSKQLRQTYSRDFLDGLFEGVERHNHELLIFQGNPARRQKPLDLIDRPLQGVVLFGMLGRSVVAHYENLECPVVVADRPMPVSSVHRILVDNIQAAYQATQRIFETGHQNAAFVYQANPDAWERKMGYLMALAHHGLKRSNKAMLNMHAEDGNRAALRKLFLGPKPFTAALATGEAEARWLMEELARLGLEVPRDVSVVSFKAKREAPASVSGPAIDFKEMGRRTYELLKEPKLPARIVRTPFVWEVGATLTKPRAK